MPETDGNGRLSALAALKKLLLPYSKVCGNIIIEFELHIWQNRGNFVTQSYRDCKMSASCTWYSSIRYHFS